MDPSFEQITDPKDGSTHSWFSVNFFLELSSNIYVYALTRIDCIYHYQIVWLILLHNIIKQNMLS